MELHWPQVAALGIVVTGVVISLVFVPPGFWQAVNWEWIGGMVLALAGVGAGAVSGKLIKPKPGPPS